MGGYGFYVWTSYASMLFILGLPLFVAWRRLNTQLKHTKKI